MQKIIRITLYVIVPLILLNSLFFIFIAVYKTVHAYVLVAQGRLEERPGVEIAESLDSFLIALFFLIFSIGIAELFLPTSNFIRGYALPWLKVDNFSDLKFILWEMLLTTLFVYFATGAIIREDHLEWTRLILPASILMLAFAYRLLKKAH